MKQNIKIFVFTNIKKYKLLFFADIVCMVSYKVLSMILPKVQSDMIDSLSQSVVYAHFISVFLLFSFVLASNFFVEFLESVFSLKFMENVSYDIRNKINDKFLKLSYSKYSSMNFSEISSLYNKELNIVKEFPLMVLDLLVSIFSVVGTMLLMIQCNSLITTIIILLLVIYLFINIKTGTIVKRYADDVLIRNQETAEVLQENFENNSIIRLFNAYDYACGRFRKNNYQYTSQSKKLEFYYAVNTMTSVVTIIIGLIFIWFIGGTELAKGNMTIGEIWMLTSYQSMLLSPLKYITNFSSKYNITLTALNRLEQYYGFEEERSGKQLISEGIKTIEIANLDFSYDNNIIFKNVNLILRKGRVYVLKGKSGTGKSTLFRLIMGDYDILSGEIKVNNININELNKKDYRKKIGYISINAKFFNDTILNNLILSGKDEFEIEQEIELIDILEEINNADDRENSHILNSGSNFSTGQLVRMDIVRNLLKEPSLLFIDEAISSLDIVRREKIYSILKSIKNEAIIIIISHNPEDVYIADEILNLENNVISSVYEDSSFAYNL